MYFWKNTYTSQGSLKIEQDDPSKQKQGHQFLATLNERWLYDAENGETEEERRRVPNSLRTPSCWAKIKQWELTGLTSP